MTKLLRASPMTSLISQSFLIQVYYLIVGTFGHLAKKGHYLNLKQPAEARIIDNKAFVIRIKATYIKPHFVFPSKLNLTISSIWMDNEPEKRKGRTLLEIHEHMG